MTRQFFTNLLAVVLLLSGSACAVSGQDKIDFVKNVQPILETHCVHCHGEKDPESMRIDIADEAMDYIEAGDAEGSIIYELITSDDEDEMMPPPDEEHALSKKQIEVIAQWINEGAEWPTGLVLKDRYKQEATPAEPAGDDPEVETSEEGNKPFVPSDLPVKPKKDKEDAEADDTVYRAIGSLHPAVLHLPIGLLMAAALFALLGIRGNFVMSDCAYYCLWLGTFGCIAACVTGWYMSPMSRMGTVESFGDLWDTDHRVYWHRLSGLVVTIVALLLSLIAAGARNRDPDDGVFWKLGVMVLAIGIAWTGHKGGELTHGKHHYDDLKKLLNSVIPMGEEVKPKAEPQNGEALGNEDATGRPGGGPVKDKTIDLNKDGKSDLGLGSDI